ncbi:MAG: hypothetical protein JXQ99_14390 [Hyphomicrobiaceae bacterium]
MGYAISWLAVKTDELDRLCDIAGVAPTTKSDAWLESDFAGSGLQGGWHLFQARGCNHQIISADFLSKSSLLGEAIACSVEEHVMVSIAEGWDAGTRRWRIAHNAQEGMFDLSASGNLPVHYEEIKDDYFAQQNTEGGESAEVDLVFDIPLEVAKRICGYKHDEEPSPWVTPGPVVFNQLDAIDAPGSKPWWRIW